MLARPPKSKLVPALGGALLAIGLAAAATAVPDPGPQGLLDRILPGERFTRDPDSVRSDSLPLIAHMVGPLGSPRYAGAAALVNDAVAAQMDHWRRHGRYARSGDALDIEAPRGYELRIDVLDPYDWIIGARNRESGASVCATKFGREIDVRPGEWTDHCGYRTPTPESASAAPDTAKFSFTEFDEPPRCLEGCAPEAIRERLREAGVEGACSTTVGIRLDREGVVTATDLLESSGDPACDGAVRTWAASTRWTPALEDGEPVVAWIAQPVRYAPGEENR